MITLIIILLISVALNIFAVWYTKNVLSRLLFISESLENLVDAVEIYRQHLKRVYELETYYGDETLKSLLDHTVFLRAELEEYSDIYNIIPFAEDFEENQTEDDEGDEDIENFEDEELGEHGQT